jgi:hypothetical protein
MVLTDAAKHVNEDTQEKIFFHGFEHGTSTSMVNTQRRRSINDPYKRTPHYAKALQSHIDYHCSSEW